MKGRGPVLWVWVLAQTVVILLAGYFLRDVDAGFWGYAGVIAAVVLYYFVQERFIRKRDGRKVVSGFFSTSIGFAIVFFPSSEPFWSVSEFVRDLMLLGVLLPLAVFTLAMSVHMVYTKFPTSHWLTRLGRD